MQGGSLSGAACACNKKNLNSSCNQISVALTRTSVIGLPSKGGARFVPSSATDGFSAAARDALSSMSTKSACSLAAAQCNGSLP